MPEDREIGGYLTLDDCSAFTRCVPCAVNRPAYGVMIVPIYAETLQDIFYHCAICQRRVGTGVIEIHSKMYKPGTQYSDMGRNDQIIVTDEEWTMIETARSSGVPWLE